MSISRVLVANRGEIAVRVIRACRELGFESVAAVSEADRDSLPARMASRAVCIGPPPPDESYLNIQAILAAARDTGADAVHPGYGFLAEAPELAAACAEGGVKFIGPRPETIRDMGNGVGIGARVADDTTVGLIEVMKVFTSVPAGVSGVISEVVVGNAEAVLQGQILFLVDPDGVREGDEVRG